MELKEGASSSIGAGSAKEKKRSSVWGDFEEIEVNGVMKIRCMHCKSLFTKNPGGATSHLIRHRQIYLKRLNA